VIIGSEIVSNGITMGWLVRDISVTKTTLKAENRSKTHPESTPAVASPLIQGGQALELFLSVCHAWPRGNSRQTGIA